MRMENTKRERDALPAPVVVALDLNLGKREMKFHSCSVAPQKNRYTHELQLERAVGVRHDE